MSFKRLALCVLIGCLLIANSSRTFAQNISSPVSGFSASDLYDAILDIKFPAPAERIGHDGLLARLRFTPARGTESQINIIRHLDGTFNVTEYFVAQDSDSIWGQLVDLASDPNYTVRDPAEIAKRFKVETRTVNVPAKVLDKLLGEFATFKIPFVSLTYSTFAVVSDTDTFSLWFEIPESCKFHFRAEGASLLNNGAKRITDWMNKVKKIVDSTK